VSRTGLRRLRFGELLALAGAACIVASLFLPAYENAGGKLDGVDTIGPAVVLLLAAATVAFALVFANLAERTPALPVAAAVWCTFAALLALPAAIVRLLERPQHAHALCAGSWVAFAGAVLVFAGAWQSMRDERGSAYGGVSPPPRTLG
jgi:hypothetical protein